MDIKRRTADPSDGVRRAGPMRLSPKVPRVTLDDVEAVVRRSTDASALRQRLDRSVRERGCVRLADVEEMIARAQGRDGVADGDHAIVVAYFAQNHPDVFEDGAERLVNAYLETADWPALMAELRSFIDELRQKEQALEREREAERAKRADDYKVEDRKAREKKAALEAANGTAEERRAEEQRARDEKAAQKAALKHEPLPAIMAALDTDDDLDRDTTDVQRLRLALHRKQFGNS